MNKDLADLKPQLIKIAKNLSKHIYFVLFVVIAGMYGYQIWQIKTLTARNPDESQVTQQINAATKPDIDTDTANKFKALEDRSPESKALFQNARQNPFQE